MAMWNRCAICGRAIPVGELCYGVKNWRGDPIGGDTICRDCLVPENAPTLTPPNEWASVEERLPESQADVLVVAFWHEHWQTMIGWHSDMGKKWRVITPHGEREPGGVTHWMTLPAPPEKKT